MRKKIGKTNQRIMAVISTLLLMLCFSGTLCAAAKNDLLLRPATLTKNLSRHVYMDIERAGSRVVAVGEMGAIVYSDDQGLSWQQAEVPTSVMLTAVYFPTEKKGWAVGHDGVVLHSSDGGQSWQKQLDGNLVNKLVLEATKNVYATLEQRVVTATADDERADLERDLEEVSFLLGDAEYAMNEGPTKPFFDVWFANEQEGLIVGAFGMIFRTEDGGENWVAKNSAIDNPDGFHYYGLAETKTALLLVGEAGIMYRSYDQGNSWEALESPYEGPMFGIGANPAGDKAVAVGLRGKIVVMKENGDSLDLRETVIPVALNAVIVSDGGSWFLTGLAGQLLRQEEENNEFVPLGVRFPGCMSIVETDGMSLILAGLGGLKLIDNSSIK
jgi:photosystem II stability/assembly factor-like uncharacterized protein